MCIRDRFAREPRFDKCRDPETVGLLHSGGNAGGELRGARFRHMARYQFHRGIAQHAGGPVSYTHLRAHETVLDLVCRLLLDKKNIIQLEHSLINDNT